MNRPAPPVGTLLGRVLLLGAVVLVPATACSSSGSTVTDGSNPVGAATSDGMSGMAHSGTPTDGSASVQVVPSAPASPSPAAGALADVYAGVVFPDLPLVS